MNTELTARASNCSASVHQITLIKSRLMDTRPDFDDIRALEHACLKSTHWQAKRGALLFHPVKISTRLYTLLHRMLRPILSRVHIDDVVVSIGLPYRHYFFGKTFPYFTLASKLRVLWIWDAWEPRLDEIAALAREARIDVLLVSSMQSTELLAAMLKGVCDVRWVPEAIDVANYRAKPWNEKTIDVLAFGRCLPRYKEAIRSLNAKGLKCVLDQRFATRQEFISAIADAKVSICFPKSVTDPAISGRISTVTHRYLQSMAGKCVIVGATPLETTQMFGYNPFIDVDWKDPAGQLLEIIQYPERFTDLVEKNFAVLNEHHQVKNFAQRIEHHISEKLQRSRV